MQGARAYVIIVLDSVTEAQHTDESMMTSSDGNIFRVTGHLGGKFIGHHGIPIKKASDAEL